MSTNLLMELMQNVTNVREYTNRPIEKADLESLYKSFSYGYSSVGNQARELLVIETKYIRKKVVESTLDPYMIKDLNNQDWLEHVPFLGIVLIEKRRAIARVGEVGAVIAEREAESALQNVRLVALSLKIGTTIVREYDANVLKEQLNLPWYVEPTAIIAAGYSEGTPTKNLHLSVNDIVSKDVWI